MDLSKAIDFIEKAENIGLLLPRTPSVDVLSAAEVIRDSLEKRKKAVGLLGDITLPQGKRVSHFQPLTSAARMPKEFIISLDTRTSPASELRYEKGDERIDIILSPKSGGILQEHVSFREGKIQCDCIIALGISDIEAAGASLKDDPDIFTRTPIINIDSSLENKKFGEVNITEGMPHSEVAYGLITALEKLPPEEHTATLLLAGILDATKQLRIPGIQPETLHAVAELVRVGGDFEEATHISRESHSLPLLQLIGRASVRSKVDETHGFLWSFLTDEDFEKTGRSEADIPFVIESLMREFPWERMLVLLSQNPESGAIQTMIAGEEEILERIEEPGIGVRSEGTITIPLATNNFKDAEDYIRSLLAGVL